MEVCNDRRREKEEVVENMDGKVCVMEEESGN
jgi:hypothetical protein